MSCARIMLAAVAAMLVTISAAQARDTDYKLKIDDVLQNPEYRGKLGNDVAFYFGSGRSPSGSMGEFVANEKTNSFGKSDETACRWAMLSALLKLKERAKKLGADTVVNIVSYYKKDEFSSATEFDCHAGALIAGVTLKGTMIKAGAPEIAKASPPPAQPAPVKAKAPTASSRPSSSKPAANSPANSNDTGGSGLGVMQ
jgi:hypothetical protein